MPDSNLSPPSSHYPLASVSPEPQGPATQAAQTAKVETRIASPKMYTVRYVLALLIIAIISVSGFVEMRARVQNATALSDSIDSTVRQYAAANKIASIAKQITAATTEAERDAYLSTLRRDYRELVTSYDAVQKTINTITTRVSDPHSLSPVDTVAELLASQTADKPTDTASILAVYFEEPYNLDKRFRDIITLAELFIASDSKTERQNTATQIEKLVIDGAADGTRLVGLGLQDAAHHQLYIAALILGINTALILVALLAIGSFVFSPLFRRVIATETALIQRIAEQKDTLRLVEQTETRLRVALEGMQDGLWDWDLRTNQVYYSDRWLSMLGYTRDELPPTVEAWHKVLYPADYHLAHQQLERHFADPDYPYQVTLRYIHKDGKLRNILARGKALRDADGKPYRITGGHTDVTELTQIQETLREQKLILELFTQNAPVAVAMLDRQLRLLNVSTRWLQDYNLTSKQSLGQSFFAVHSHFPIRWTTALREALSGIQSNADEDSFERPAQDGKPAETVFVRWRLQPWRDSQGFIGGVILFSEMIGEEVKLRRDVARASGLNQALAEFVSTELLYTGTATEPSIEEICRFAAQSLQLSRAGVWRIDNDGDVATNLRMYESRTEEFKSGQELQRVDCFNFFARLSMNRPATFDDASTSDLVSQQMLDYLGGVHVKAAMCVPIRVEQKIWGFLSLAADTERHWQNYELFFGQRLADVVAISLTAHQRHLLNASLTKAREAAETAAVTKSRFVANMSHEVRTPLNGIIGVAEILSRTELSQKQSELVHVLQTSCQHLLALVNDILDFSKLEAGSVKLENISFNLAQMVRELTELMRPKTDSGDVEVIVNYQARLPHVFIGDPTRIRQVLMNLLSNAIKFTNKGDIVISVGGHESDDGNWLLDLSVTDSGIGIAADKIPTLFEKFTQADSSTTRKYGGTGLGLTIIKELVELMGGKVHVTSIEGRGSTFTVTIPLVVDRSVPRALPPALLRGCRILVLDDNHNSQQAIIEQLRGLGARGDAHGTTESTLEAAHLAVREKAQFDIALVDVELENFGAYDFAKAIKQDDALRDISLVAMCTSEQITEEALLTKGFVAILRKPVSPIDLMHTLQGVMQARRTGNMTTLYASGHAAAQIKSTKSSSLKGARVLLAEDNETNQMIVAHFLNELGCIPVTAANGREAVAAFTRDPDFAAIIMDCQMPEMDGFAATAAIRALPQGTNVPILALTANAQDGDREACLRAGMNSYMAKPVRLDTLRQRLTSLLDPAPAAPLSPAPAVQPVPTIPDQPLSMTELTHAFGNDMAIIKRIITSFIANATDLLSQADTQLKNQDYVALAKTAHTLKGASLSVFAGPFSDDAKRFEVAAKGGSALECGYLLNLLRRHLNQIEGTTKD